MPCPFAAAYRASGLPWQDTSTETHPVCQQRRRPTPGHPRHPTDADAHRRHRQSARVDHQHRRTQSTASRPPSIPHGREPSVGGQPTGVAASSLRSTSVARSPRRRQQQTGQFRVPADGDAAQRRRKPASPAERRPARFAARPRLRRAPLAVADSSRREQRATDRGADGGVLPQAARRPQPVAQRHRRVAREDIPAQKSSPLRFLAQRFHQPGKVGFFPANVPIFHSFHFLTLLLFRSRLEKLSIRRLLSAQRKRNCQMHGGCYLHAQGLQFEPFSRDALLTFLAFCDDDDEITENHVIITATDELVNCSIH